MTEPGWLPDPTARHELRWFDGDRFTDQVADGGVRATDPGAAPPPPEPEAALPPPPSAPGPSPLPPSPSPSRPAAPTGPAPGGALGWPEAPPSTWVVPGWPSERPEPASLESRSRRRRRPVLPIVLAVVVVLALVAGGAYWWFEVKGPATGAGTFAGELSGRDPLGVHRIFVPAGSIAVVTVNPDDDLDAVVGFVPDDEDDALAVEDLYDGTGFGFVAAAVPVEDAFGDDVEDEADVRGDRAVMVVDTGFEDQPERTFLLLGDDAPAAVVVAGFPDLDSTSTGGYDVIIDVIDLELEPDVLARLRGRQALDLASRDERVPEVFRALIDETD